MLQTLQVLRDIRLMEERMGLSHHATRRDHCPRRRPDLREEIVSIDALHQQPRTAIDIHRYETRGAGPPASCTVVIASSSVSRDRALDSSRWSLRITPGSHATTSASGTSAIFSKAARAAAIS